LRLAILAALLIGAYLLVARPLLDKGEKAVSPVTRRVDRLGRCAERAHGDAHRLYRCAVKP
jgi:hypothetical protein